VCELLKIKFTSKLTTSSTDARIRYGGPPTTTTRALTRLIFTDFCRFVGLSWETFESNDSGRKANDDVTSGELVAAN
jgi:hypothetical protein